MLNLNPESPTQDATEMVSRYFRRPVHKKGRQWLEDNLGQQRLFAYNPANPLHIVSTGKGKHGVFMFNQLLKQLTTKAAATKHLNALKAKAKKLQQNPHEFETPDADDFARIALETYDVDSDGDLDFNDVELIEENEQPVMVAIESGEIGELVSTTEDGNYLVQMQSGGFDVFPGEDLTVLESDAPELVENGFVSRFMTRRKAGNALRKRLRLETALGRAREKEQDSIHDALETNPAMVRKVGNYYQIQLPNRKFLRDGGGRIWKTRSKKQAREVAATTKIDAGAEIAWLQSLHRRQNPLPSLSMFANGAVGLLSAMQIKDRLTTTRRTKRVPKKTATRRNPVMMKNKTAFKAELEKVLRRKLTNSTADKKYLNSFYADYCKSIKAINDKHTPKKNPATAKTATTKPTTKANPGKIKRRKAFEMFQGRPATNMRPMQVSKHAPKNLEQIGDLVEIKLANGEVMNFERQRNGKSSYPFKLTMNPQATRLWIAGGKFARKNPGLGVGQIEIIEPIEHVVYATYKPHIEGDEIVRHYIHALGEDSGEMPHLGVDNEGFPIVHGGAYSIEDRGIIN